MPQDWSARTKRGPGGAARNRKVTPELFPRWVISLLAILLLGPLLAGFGYVVLEVERGEKALGVFGLAAHSIAEVPDTLKQLLHGKDRMKTFMPRRFADRPAGWTVAPGTALPGYVLLSRYDGARRRHVVELVSLSDMSVRHVWTPDAATLLANAARTSKTADYTSWTREAWRAIHPLPMPDGGLIVKDHFGPLLHIDACGGLVWMNDTAIFHHTTESDGEGGFWVPSVLEPQTIAGVPGDFREDVLTHVGPDGTILWRKSLTQLLLDNGMEYAVFPSGDYDEDPIHLNDIQPVLSDGAYWKKGDLFLSMRRLSMIALYRPSTDRIIWKKQGPWLVQHDVDIIGPTQIGVFNNNAYNRGNGPYIKGASGVMVYDFATDTVTEPWKAALDRGQVKSLFEGLFTVLPDGTAMVEEENAGRLLFVGTDGTTKAEFINTGPDGDAYRLGWSRWLDPATGDAMAAKLAGTTCPATP